MPVIVIALLFQKDLLSAVVRLEGMAASTRQICHAILSMALKPDANLVASSKSQEGHSSLVLMVERKGTYVNMLCTLIVRTYMLTWCHVSTSWGGTV